MSKPKMRCRILGHKYSWEYNRGLDASWHGCERCGAGHWNDRLMCEGPRCVALNREEAWMKHRERVDAPPELIWAEAPGGRSYVLRPQLFPGEAGVDRFDRHDADCESRTCRGCA